MSIKISRIIILLLLVTGNCVSKCQDTAHVTRILFVFDASNSMNGQWQSSSKILVARKLLAQTVEALKINPEVELGLRVYGHQTAKRTGVQDCNDTRLEVPFSKNSHDDIINTIYSITPKGTTPIALSLEKAAGDFPVCKGCRNIIILITDGIEACDGDPCAISKALQEKGIILKPFVIGIGVQDQFKYDFQCIGNYYDASNEENFEQVMQIVITQALNTTTTQVYLNNSNGDPLETDVPMTFYDNTTGEQLYNFVHTINYKGNPDTLGIDPIPTYRLVVHTIPEVEKSDIKLIPGKHNIINMNTPQGTLDLNIAGFLGNYYNVSSIITDSRCEKVLNEQDINSSEKYLVGDYKLTILTLPRLYFDISIEQSETTKIEIPQSGTADITLPGYGIAGVFKINDDELEWVCNMPQNVPKKRYELLPGNYVVIYRSNKVKESLYTIKQNFHIDSGSTTVVKF